MSASGRFQTPAPAGSLTAAPTQPERAPVRCDACGHVRIPAVYCANPDCGHLEEVHAFNSTNTVRKACSHHEGADNKKCPCKTFIDPKDTETPR